MAQESTSETYPAGAGPRSVLDSCATSTAVVIARNVAPACPQGTSADHEISCGVGFGDGGLRSARELDGGLFGRRRSDPNAIRHRRHAARPDQFVGGHAA